MTCGIAYALPAMTRRKLFVAGATGATGQVLTPMARAEEIAFVPHVRPKSAANAPPEAAIVDLGDAAALAKAMKGCTTVVQLIGTMRKRFASGDTYETSDIGTTRQLVDAAKACGTVDHVVLLSSVGAGRPLGAYLKAKARTEAIVTGSGLGWTIFRPSVLEGGDRGAAPAMRAITGALGMAKYKPIRLEELAAAMLHVALLRAPLGVALEGRALWKVVDEAEDPAPREGTC